MGGLSNLLGLLTLLNNIVISDGCVMLTFLSLMLFFVSCAISSHRVVQIYVVKLCMPYSLYILSLSILIVLCHSIKFFSYS